MAKAEEGACMFLVDLPDPAIRIEHVPNTIDSSMPGGHAIGRSSTTCACPRTRCSGRGGRGLPLCPGAPRRRRACRTACAGSAPASRANEIATDYACRRHAFGKPLVDHEGVGFMLAENLIDLKQAELMIRLVRRSARHRRSLGTAESSMAKVAVSEALMRIADRCVQVMGGTGRHRQDHRRTGVPRNPRLPDL